MRDKTDMEYNTNTNGSELQSELSPSESHSHLSDTKLPDDKGDVPPTESKEPPGKSEMTASENGLPPSETELLAHEAEIRRGDNDLPPSKTELSSHETDLPPPYSQNEGKAVTISSNGISGSQTPPVVTQPSANTSCIQKISKQISSVRNTIILGLEKFFYKLGVIVATYPFITILIGVLIPGLLTIGMMNFKVNEDFADLLLPPSSRIHEDRAWVEEHVPYEQRPIRLILQADNVLTRESMLQLYEFHVKYREIRIDDKEEHTFDALCVKIASNCLVDSVMALWLNDPERLKTLTEDEILYDINTVTQNPMYFFAFNSTRMLGQIRRNSTGHIVGAGIMHADWFLQSSIQLKPTIKKFEDVAIDISLQPHPFFSFVTVFTIDSYDEEFFKGVYGDIILIVYGLPVVLLYITLALGNVNLVEHGVYMTLVAVFGVVLSAGACYGIGLTAGLSFGAPHQALIFLLFAVGVDDSFVVVTTWRRVNKSHPNRTVVERVGLTMQHAGVSVTVTSFSDLVAFGCGISTQMPLLRSFCVYCSIGILFLFLIQSTVFPAFLTINQWRVEASRDALIPCLQYEDYKPNKFSQVEIVKSFFDKIFAPALLSNVGKVIVILATLGLAGTMVYGVTNIRKGYEIERSLPVDSYVRKFLEAQRLYFSTEGPGIQVFCGPMDYQKNLPAIDEMANKYVNSSVIMYGLVANWIPIYKLYVQFQQIIGKDLNLNEDGVPSDEDTFYLELKEFFEHPFGIPFSKYIELTNDTKPRIKWTYFPMQQIVSQDVWMNEYIMEEVRGIADTTELEGGRCFVYSVFHIFTEVIRYVDGEITRNFILAGCAVFLVTLILIVDVVTSFFVFICVVLTMVDIMGALHFWDFYLDVNLVVLLVISVGLAVDFSAHIGYTFMTVVGNRKERAKKTICTIGPAIFHGAVTTFLVFFVLIFGRSLSAFFATFILVVLFGLFHGLCFLPVVLSLIGPAPYDSAIDDTLTSENPAVTYRPTEHTEEGMIVINPNADSPPSHGTAAHQTTLPTHKGEINFALHVEESDIPAPSFTNGQSHLTKF